MTCFTKHELEIIEIALVRYLDKLESGIFAEREGKRIKVILAKIDDLSTKDYELKGEKQQ